MRKFITITEVGAITMVTAFAMNKAEELEDGPVKEMMIKDIRAIQVLAGEIQWEDEDEEEYTQEDKAYDRASSNAGELI